MRLSAKRASEREEEGEGEREKERALVRMVHRVNVGKVGIIFFCYYSLAVLP